MPEIRAVVDHHRCVGVGMCVQTVPGAFILDRAGLSEFHTGEWSRAELVDAADSCPMSAITVYVDDVEVT